MQSYCSKQREVGELQEVADEPDSDGNSCHAPSSERRDPIQGRSGISGILSS